MRHGGPQPARLLLASRSPRRTSLLADAGIAHQVIDSGLDDAELEPGRVSPAAWVSALAYLKARAALEQARPGDAILGADTVCVMDGRIIGQPRDDAHAAGMIMNLMGGEHDVLTGLCVLRPADAPTGPDTPWTDTRPARVLRHDRARVRMGHLPMREVSGYVASGEWRGKAGGYNYTQRHVAGWPLEVDGDEETVVGLQVGMMRRMLMRAMMPGSQGDRPSSGASTPSRSGSCGAV